MKLTKNQWMWIIGIVALILFFPNQMQKETLYDRDYEPSCDSLYSAALSDGDQCVLKGDLTSSLKSCFDDCGESYDSDSICYVFAEVDACRTTAGGSFGDRDACIYNCILEGGGTGDLCPNECEIDDTYTQEGKCYICDEDADPTKCNHWYQTSMDVCTCGDGTCGYGEDELNCPADCSAPGPKTVGEECLDHDECEGDLFCVKDNTLNKKFCVDIINPSTSCEDSDGGHAYTTYGNVYLSTALRYYDYCFEDTSQLWEYYCSENEARVDKHECPKGCLNGVCKESSATCGDGVCSSTESYESCPADCEKKEPIDWGKYLPWILGFFGLLVGVKILGKAGK